MLYDVQIAGPFIEVGLPCVWLDPLVGVASQALPLEGMSVASDTPQHDGQKAIKHSSLQAICTGCRDPYSTRGCGQCFVPAMRTVLVP